VARLPLLILLAVVVTGCGSRQRAAPQSVTFGGVEGYLVDPGMKGRHAGVVLVHGSGGDRTELLGQAQELASEGVVALTITEPSSVHPPGPAATVAKLLAETKRSQDADVAAIRAAAGFLAARPDVDGARLGYLGWSSGAKLGAFVTDRFRALALLSAGAQPVSAFVAAAPPGSRALVRRVLTPLDPIGAIGRARPGTVLLEDGRRDAVVPRAALLAIVHAAPPGTIVRWYDAGHALDARAYADARAFLVAHLMR
jgi:dienelactone hydrolase